jgi:Protein of unknown function (DUF3052)
MAGYSGTPLAKKLGIKDDFRVALLRVPEEVRSELQDALAKCRIVKQTRGPLDFVFLFAKSVAELENQLTTAAKALAPAGMLWLSWPKQASGIPTDLTGNLVRQRGLEVGLVDVKVCAVTDIWSGLKFVIPVKNRPPQKRRIV